MSMMSQRRQRMIAGRNPRCRRASRCGDGPNASNGIGKEGLVGRGASYGQ